MRAVAQHRPAKGGELSVPPRGGSPRGRRSVSFRGPRPFASNQPREQSVRGLLRSSALSLADGSPPFSVLNARRPRYFRELDGADPAHWLSYFDRSVDFSRFDLATAPKLNRTIAAKQKEIFGNKPVLRAIIYGSTSGDQFFNFWRSYCAGGDGIQPCRPCSGASRRRAIGWGCRTPPPWRSRRRSPLGSPLRPLRRR